MLQAYTGCRKSESEASEHPWFKPTDLYVFEFPSSVNVTCFAVERTPGSHGYNKHHKITETLAPIFTDVGKSSLSGCA
jgi:hypothetical protein